MDREGGRVDEFVVPLPIDRTGLLVKSRVLLRRINAKSDGERRKGYVVLRTTVLVHGKASGDVACR
jgi:hypothetical protein